MGACDDPHYAVQRRIGKVALKLASNSKYMFLQINHHLDPLKSKLVSPRQKHKGHKVALKTHWEMIYSVEA
jgi:hypothetical protein